MKHKIAFLIGTMRCGGAQRVVSVLSKYFVNYGWDVSVVTTSDSIVDYSLEDEVQILALSDKLDGKLFRRIRTILEVRKALKKQKYQYVVAFLPMTCIYVAICKALGGKFKYIASERMDPYQDPDSKALRQLRNWAYSKADGMVFQTKNAQMYFSKKIQKKSCIIFNPVNEKIPSQYYGKREKRIVSAIRLEKQKNIPMLIDAFARFHTLHPEYNLEIYGKGSMQNELQNKIEEKGLSQSFFLKGFCADVYKKMERAEFFVLPSDYEGVSNSMLEALCMGLPVVSTNHPIGGAQMFIHNNKNGYLTPVRDSEAFFFAMDKMAKLSGEDYQKFSDAAYEVRNQLHPDAICKQWEEFILK